jgi:hypothetical protein
VEDRRRKLSGPSGRWLRHGRRTRRRACAIVSGKRTTTRICSLRARRRCRTLGVRTAADVRGANALAGRTSGRGSLRDRR